MNTSHTKATLRTQRHNRLRHKVTGTAARPRLAVYRSNKFVYAQVIDDETGTTLASADSRKVAPGTGVEKATLVGAAIAKAAQAAKIETVVFDRGGFQYVGIVKAVAEGAREGGLKF
jgi:large subunit ribosomal protein L18